MLGPDRRSNDGAAEDLSMQSTPLLPFAVALLALGASFPGSTTGPDEGMWLFDALPLKTLKEKYDFEPTQEWIDHVRLGSVRLDTGARRFQARRVPTSCVTGWFIVALM